MGGGRGRGRGGGEGAGGGVGRDSRDRRIVGEGAGVCLGGWWTLSLRSLRVAELLLLD